MVAWAGIADLPNRGNVNYPTNALLLTILKYCVLYPQNWPFPWCHFGLFSPADFFEHNLLFMPAQSCFWKRRSWSSCTPMAVDRRNSCVCFFSPLTEVAQVLATLSFILYLCFASDINHPQQAFAACHTTKHQALSVSTAQFCCSSVNNVHGCCAPSESET